MSTKSDIPCPKCHVVPNPGCLCTGGYKADHDKPDLSLLPPEWKAEVAKAMTYGAKKYSRDNYLTGMDWSRMRAAADRHLDAFWRNEDIDPETGIHHLGHASACILMLFMHAAHNLGTDNRWKGPKK